MSAAVLHLDLDLDVFTGPFDLLLSLILRDEVELLEVELAEVVVTYLDLLEQRGELDLEAATEFLVLIAALLELKSRLLLPQEEVEELLEEMQPGEAAEELLARLLQYARYRGAAGYLRDGFDRGQRILHRTAPPPAALRRASIQAAEAVWAPERLGAAIGELLKQPAEVDLRHMAQQRVSVDTRLSHLRTLLRRAASIDFDDAVRGADRVTEAVTVWALLELYKRGEADWHQEVPFGPITVRATSPAGTVPLVHGPRPATAEERAA